MSQNSQETVRPPAKLPKLVWHKLSMFGALELKFGRPDPKQGSVIVDGPCGLKHYRFRRRAGDGHYVTRWGRLVGATVCRDNSESGRVVSIIFEIDPTPRAALAKAGAA